MLALAYVSEGLVRAASDHGAGQALAMGETLLATLLFAGCLGYARASAPSRSVKAAD